MSSQLRAETELTVEDFSTWNVGSQAGSYNRGMYVDQSTATVNGLLLLVLIFISLQRITGFDVYIKEAMRRWREESKKDPTADDESKRDLDA